MRDLDMEGAGPRARRRLAPAPVEEPRDSFVVFRERELLATGGVVVEKEPKVYFDETALGR